MKKWGWKANFLREATASTDVEKTMRSAVAILADCGIPSLVVGGVAVQENGYPRLTIDVDLVVPDVKAAIDQLSMRGFRLNQGSNMTVTDRDTHVEVDLLPGGGSVGRGPLMLPMPHIVSKKPNIVDLKTLIEIKLSSYIGSPGFRLKDAADVIELIKANDLYREFSLSEKVNAAYLKLWDELKKDENNFPKN